MAKDKAKARVSINPFQKLRTQEEILSAAKVSAMVSGYIALSYSLQAGLIYFSGTDLFGNGGRIVLVSDLIAVAFALLLTWRTIARQPLWAAIVTAAWYYIELAGKFAGIGQNPGSAAQSFNFGFLVMFLALASGAIIGIRGAWKLRKGGVVADVFE